jgi:hypothetical protein
MKITIITLTVIGLLAVPLVPLQAIAEGDSSAIAAWQSSITANFTGEVGDNPSYDFRSFGTAWYEPLDVFINIVGSTLETGKEFVDNVANFLLNPIVGVFEDVTGPVGEGAPESLDFLRLSYILSYQVFNSRYDLVENELSEDEIFYIGGFSWISDPVLNYYFNFERWWIGCFCTEPSLQEIAAAS